MDFEAFKGEYYFFNLADYGRIFVFVDFGNVRPWAKELWPEENKFRFCMEVDIAKLSAVCDWVKPLRKYFYYGHFSPNQGAKLHASSMYRIDRARKSGFYVKTKEIKMIPQYDDEGKFLGKVPKCNFDVEMTMHMMMKVEKYDTIMLFSGDSDFGGLLQYLKTKGKKVVVVSTRSRMSRELEAVADVVVPAETLSSFLKYEQKNTPSR